MEKLYASKTFLKMAGERMHIPHPTPLDSPLAISYTNHQESGIPVFQSLGAFSRLLFFLLKGRVKRGEGAWHNGPLP